MVHVESTKAGCLWIVATHVRKDAHPVDKYCRRICASGSAYCPKHRLMDEEREAEAKRKMEHARKGKEKKQLFREALKASPLRAVNPNFPEEKATGYES